MGTTRKLTQIEHQLAAAWVAGYHTFHERILSDDWGGINSKQRTQSAKLREPVREAIISCLSVS